MRHFFLPRAVTRRPRGVVAAAIGRALIVPAGGTLFAAPGRLGAPSIAVEVAAVATGADQRPGAAARAEIGARSPMRLFGLSTEPWTNPATDEILPRHTCSRTVWGAAPIRTSRLGSAPCLSSMRTSV